MIYHWIIAVLVLLQLVLSSLAAVTIVDHRNDDESLLEHEVTYDKAIEQATTLKLYPGPIPGCKACTSEEMTYCRDGRVIEDHCCCDAGYNEVLGFVEHTCRVGPEACEVRAGDCAEYSRLRECCCHNYLASKWKYLAGGSTRVNKSNSLLGLTLLLILIARLR